MTNIIACPLDKQKETYIWPLPFNWENIQIISTKYQKWIFEEKIQNVRLICESIMWKLNLKLFKKKNYTESRSILVHVERCCSQSALYNTPFQEHDQTEFALAKWFYANKIKQMRYTYAIILWRLHHLRISIEFFFHFLFTNMLRKWCSPTIRIPVQHFSYKST